ncbi:hypothetical protein QBC47DRAFT_464338 [Echria macrotheca]|uniref:Uncharacterized protein n=1 Tax=Echria macrotheca TaxID=438768 RepID=A0AAJ0B3R5_9PEZI|nr:hypothetical protein QBC47DRAFT_464338 [Echria macrotheca]
MASEHYLDPNTSESDAVHIFNVPSRVGAPPPHPFPVASLWDSQCIEIDKDIGKKRLVGVTCKILSAEKVDKVISVELISRIPLRSNMLPQGQPTIVIVARWTDDGCSVIWGRAVSRIKKWVDSIRVSSKTPNIDIAVEMIGEEHVKEKYMAPVESGLLDRGLREHWALIKDDVGRILDSFSQTKGHVTSIHLFRLGFSTIYGDNPNTVRDSEKYQREAKLVPSMPYKQQVSLGSDISVSKYIKTDDGREISSPVGTMGCWLEIKTKSEPEWTKVALTNYHVIRPWYDGFHIDKVGVVGQPTAGSELWRMDTSGISPSDDVDRPLVEHPSRAKHNHGVVRSQQLAELLPDHIPRGKKAREDLQHIIPFFDNNQHRLGRVFCASGFMRRTATGGRLDWALIRPASDDRVGNNTLPSLRDWEAKYVDFNCWPHYETDEGPLQQPTERGLRVLQQGDGIYKLGATTGVSSGKHQETKGNVAVSDDQHVAGSKLSEEFAYVQAEDHVFSAAGDSGSVAWDRKGRAVGLVFGGLRPTGVLGTAGLTYITPIHDVFKDIMEFSDGEITDIRIAE